MSVFARLIIVDPTDDITEPGRFDAERPLLVQDVLRHYGDSKSFVSNFYPVYNEQTLNNLPVSAHRLPSDFHIADFTGEEKFIHNDGNTPFYYVTAGELKQLDFGPTMPDPRDRAMMAYIRALPSNWRIIPYVIF